ncbi:ribosomal-processing cysteine protease Prp [Tumebacillus sp. DT12]|uniref:Ribosomal processing cysteine protease Prp n=1 Tax=Tumebacillus lacus TaxID=2995335 RepID=A0ABT3X6E2_9BACL|nr:ribosomal-processing cysteine protease Prp [Tumebacillus lacus]MCX7571417.1 ribosomal-processing cysteine protease Prp [Tumebacillus lacus]
MIRANVWRNGQGHIDRFSVRGHAEAADPGYDIVCAAVSVLVTNAINSAEQLLRVHIADDEQVAPGDVQCSIPALSGAQNEKLQLLFESMVFGIQQVADLYPDFVNLTVKSQT